MLVTCSLTLRVSRCNRVAAVGSAEDLEEGGGPLVSPLKPSVVEAPPPRVSMSRMISRCPHPTPEIIASGYPKSGPSFKSALVSLISCVIGLFATSRPGLRKSEGRAWLVSPLKPSFVEAPSLGHVCIALLAASRYGLRKVGGPLVSPLKPSVVEAPSLFQQCREVLG